MNDLKNDYDYNKEIQLVQAKAEAKQLTRKLAEYRGNLIGSMNAIIKLKKVNHKTDVKDIVELTKHMTKLNRQAFIFRKMLGELKQARKKLAKRKNNEPV